MYILNIYIYSSYRLPVNAQTSNSGRMTFCSIGTFLIHHDAGSGRVHYVQRLAVV